MRDGGRLSAAIEVLGEMAARHKPAHLALRAWGEGARYAGAKDRAFVSGLVLDVLRRRRSLAWRMGEETDRARALAALAFDWGWAPERIAAAAEELHGPGALTAPEFARLSSPARLEAAPAFERGWFEVQDAGSQVAALAAGEIAHRQVLDFCAGGGGKTLALAAAMNNTGQLYAYDADARRLAETVKRAQRAGVRNLQVRSPIDPAALSGLENRMDLVFVDSPCTGSGTWRRHPDAKWRLTPQQLERRMAEQDAVLAAAAGYVKPGGRMVYVTCSLLAEENEDRVAAFLAAQPSFVRAPVAIAGAEPWLTSEGYLRLTPRTAGTDGFFVAALSRS